MAVTYSNLGGVLFASNRLDEAAEQLQDALRLDPRIPEAHVSLCTILKLKKGPRAVIEHYEEVLRNDPDWAPAHIDLGVALAEAKQTDAAIDQLQHAIRIDPQQAAAYHNLGLVLFSQNQWAEAANHFEKAVAIDPKLALAHAALGQALLVLGRFRDAQAATRRSLDLLTAKSPHRPTVTRQLERVEQMLALEVRIPAILRGEARPGNGAEALQMGQVCHLKKQYLAAARLAADAFADQPALADDPAAGHRYNAACAAALAGCGRGEGGDKLSDAERTRWREQARDWLRADLAAWGKKLAATTAADRARVRQTLTHWQADPDLEGVRDPDALDRLSAPERQQWHTVWADVDALLKRSQDVK
jgi:serine/threonine-protein kinase